MGVPNTSTFSLQDVVNEVNPTTDDLVDCFADAIASSFDSTYSGSKDQLLNFRNYGNSTPVVSLTTTENQGYFLNLSCTAGSIQTWVASGSASETVTGYSANFTYNVSSPAVVDIDITNPAVTELYMTNCDLTSATITNNVNLTEIAINVNSLTTIDFSSNTALEDLYCDNNNLTSIDLQGCTSLSFLRAYNNTSLTSLTRMNNFTSLNYLDISNTNLSSANKDLVYIDLNNNGQSNGILRIDIGRTSASNSARASLIFKGWTIQEV